MYIESDRNVSAEMAQLTNNQEIVRFYKKDHLTTKGEEL